MQQQSMELKDKCTGCGTVADLYGSNCGHLTLCLKCGKAMAETAAPCAECGIPVTRLIRAENRWAGVCLLGVTCQKCTRQKFLESYNTWFLKLLESLKSTDPIVVRAAACASLNDLIVRLGGFIGVTGVRRDGANLVSKLVQPLLQIMGDKGSSGIWDEVMDLLSTMLRHFPACLRQHSSSVEALLVARIRDVECHSSLSEKCAKALALLPKAHGDATTWSSLIRRILIAINYDLDFAFRGMEDAATAERATAALLPRGQDPPLLLGGHSVSANTFIQPGKSLWQQLVPRVALLLQSCNHLLTSPFPVPVPAPLSPLLALAMRILHVDGSRSSLASSLGVTASHQAALCAELPALHLSALQLLESTLCGVRSHLLPRGADLVRLLTDHFRRCGVAHPSLRIKLYAIARHLFVAMGAGMASALAPAIVGNALSDLKCSMLGANMTSLARAPQNTVLASGGWTASQGAKKRKEPGGIPSHHAKRMGDELSVTGEGVAPVAVQIAALQALEALLTSGGALLPDRWRAEVDTVLASVAIGAGTGTMSASLMSDETSFMESTPPCSTSTQFQIAAYQALLASLLSPCCHRPPYLAQGLTVFRNGRKEAGTEVAVVCARALLALEPLIHPRSLPPISTPSAVTGRSANGGTFASRLQGLFNNPISEPGSMAAVHTNNTVNGFAVSGISSFKIGQMAMDPWAEVDTWLGYGEDCDDDNSLSHPVSNEIHDKGLANSDDQGVSTPGNKFQSDSELQVPLACVENGVKMHGEIRGNIQGNITENHPLPISQSRKTGLDNSFGEEIAGVQNSSISISVELPLQGENLQGIQTASAGQDKEAVALDVVGIAGTFYPVAEVGRMPSADQDTEMCSNIESVIAPTEIVSIQVMDIAHPLVVAGSSTGRIVDLTGDSDNSDSDGPLPDIIDGDPDSDSD